MATSNYAEIYGWPDIGSIEPGRVADILILDNDPRMDTSAADHINTIVFRGGSAANSRAGMEDRPLRPTL